MNEYEIVTPDGERIFVNADDWEVSANGLIFRRGDKVVAWFLRWDYWMVVE